MKKRTLILLFSGLFVACVVGRLAWIQMTSVTLEESAPSPNGKFLAKVSSKWSDRFWDGAPREIHDLRIESKEGQIVRRVVTEESWTGWLKDSILKWEADGSSISVTYKVHEALSTQLSVKIL